MNYATELILVLADGLTESDRKQVSLVALAALLHRRRRPDKLVTFDEAELGRQAKTIISQLAASGLADDPRRDVQLFCLSILDSLADLAPDEIVRDASMVRQRLVYRVAARHAGVLPEGMARSLRLSPYTARLARLQPVKEKQP